jgi:Uma2 family endonuclease
MSTVVRSAQRLTREPTLVAQSNIDGIPHRFTFRFSVKQYHDMIAAGILTANDRVELLKGWIVDKMPHNAPHDAGITRTNRRLSRLLPDEWLLLVQCAITLRTSEPEPDFAIVAGPEHLYSRQKPRARDVRLLMEVADSTLLYDRRWKLQLYAEARIPEYWIINVLDNCIEVYTDPKGGKAAGYRRQKVYTMEKSIPLVLDGRHIADIPVRDLLPA